ncbi:MAG: M23 family metallopeptidase [Acidobacteria bacterium]|nr:M23 family metallopeptidase [Acidobacteriota bacterium]
MRSRRYTIVLADRSTGAVRRFTLATAPTLAVLAVGVSLPLLMGLGVRWSAMTELTSLKAANTNLQLENSNYRRMTGDLIGQISSLQTAIGDLKERSAVDPVVAKAMKQLRMTSRATAVGGATPAASALPLLSTALLSPESTFGMLQTLLRALETRLQLVRTDVERRQLLAASTPSIWPAHGWLTAPYGQRADPFTGEPAFHPALDISADSGQPVFATAAGTIESASYTGAYGNLVVIDHGFGLRTRYGHLARFAVKTGAKVTRGDVIGYVGATGRATGSHVHYEVWADGRPVNPLRLLTSNEP